MLSTAVCKAIEAGRVNGRIILSGQDLENVPLQVYDADVPLPPVKGTKAAAGEGEWWGWDEVKKLDLSRNRLRSLPNELTNLASLTSLDVSYNHLELLPPDFSTFFQLASLAVNNNQLQALPSLPHSLVLLSAQHNRLSSLPPSLARCSELTKLDCAHNMIQALPEEAMQGLSHSLTELDCSCNQLTALPAEIGRLSKLKVLHVVHNKLTSLPSSIGNCRSLVELHAGQNALREIPPVLALCTSLRHLSLRDNRIQEVPQELCGLQLYVLDLQSCDLSSLPPQLGLMTSLKSLLLEGNALRTIRRPLITGPVSNLLKFLASRIPEGEGAASSRTQVAQSGNVFAQDADALAADMARKLAVAQGGGGGVPPSASGSGYGQDTARSAQSQYQAQPGPHSYTQPQQQQQQQQLQQQQLYSQQGYYGSQQQGGNYGHHVYGGHGANNYAMPNSYGGYDGYASSQQGYGGSSMHPYSTGQPYSHQAYGPGQPYRHQGYSQAHYPMHPQQQQQMYGQHQAGVSDTYGYSGRAGGYAEAFPRGATHVPAAAAHSTPYQQQTPGPYAPSQHSAPSLAPAAGFKAAHSTAPFATEATPPLPPPQPTVGKTSLPKAELILSGMGLRSAPAEVWEAAFGLSKLNLSSNQISRLPLEGMAQLTQLRSLLLCRAGLTAWPLPPSPNSLSQLRELVLSGNRNITSIPAGAFVSCPGLVSLELSGVPGAGSMPQGTLSVLSNLQRLDLSFTSTTQFPLQELLPIAGTLRVLNLSSNRICSLPADVARLVKLEELCLSNNELGNLPPQLGLLSGTLRSLTLDGNPLRSIRRPIIERGTAAVLEYLKERIPS
ncbi:hypothetical protein DUNSADRAFT_17177 [Dunaliella salina]|uniref:Leucine-rich repeat-containing protein 40 n=1 Tax=Dunaliella salina TaxID=3046 RepID=A0ABQ7G2A2_DUNSA|nr:hypothetical protein DUNSADRAFT_17177 [Dunaliella salina]|eukprot:KAF5828725.1 hypothetical protein DUNSADRAFT_17177 [Dunaliella salina]